MAYRCLGFSEDRRDFSIAAKILEYYSIKSIRLISSNKSKRKAVEDVGIKVNELIHYSGNIIKLSGALDNTITSIKEGSAQSPISKSSRKDNRRQKIFVIGDLNIDYQISNIKGGMVINKPKPKVGGTGYNATLSFLKSGFTPIMFGKVGDDQQGKIIQEVLKEKNFFSLLGIQSYKINW